MEHKWSEQQENIFNWFETGNLGDAGSYNRNLIVRARAGTGKTTVIIEGVKRAPEKSILICAFSKIIQEELLIRIGRDYPHIQAKTLHSVGYSCVRRFRERIGVKFNDERAVKLTETVCGSRAPDSVKRLVTKLHTKGREIAPHAEHLGDLTNIAIEFDCIPDESWSNSGFDLDYVEMKALEAMEFAANIQSGEFIDGSDMVYLPIRNGWLTGQFDLVVADECQDLTTAQLEIAQGVMRSEGRICLVGDDRQAIFGFRGADSGSLDRLKQELHAAELGLTITYRCGKSIVRLAQELVPDFESGPDNPEGLISEISTKDLVKEAGPGNFILSRVNAPLVGTAMQLLRAGKRTRVAGRDIGKGLINLVRKLHATSVPDFLRKIESWETREIGRLQTLLSKAINGRKSTIQSKIEGVQDQTEMLLNLADGAKNINEMNDRIENLFTDDGLGVGGMITCSSVHRAKGLEADKVFILRDTLRYYNQEESNIIYVAETRSKSELVWVTDKPTDKPTGE